MFEKLFRENEIYLSGFDEQLKLYGNQLKIHITVLVNDCHDFIFNHLRRAYDGMKNIQKEHNISDALLETPSKQASKVLLIAENALKLITEEVIPVELKTKVGEIREFINTFS